MVTALFELLQIVLQFYTYAVIAAAIYSLLVSFGVIDTRNRLVWTIGDFLYRVTEPVLRPIRNLLPSFGGIDLSPWVLVVLLGLVRGILLPKLYFAIESGDVRSLLL